MYNTKPITDLENYNKVLSEVEFGKPVILTKNGKSKYVMMDINEYERMQSILKLLNELAKGDACIKKEDYISIEKVKEILGINNN